MSSRYEIASTNRGLFNKDIISRYLTEKHKKRANKIRDHFATAIKNNPYKLTNKQLQELSEENTIDYYIKPILDILGYYHRSGHSGENRDFPDVWMFLNEPESTSSKYLQGNNLTILEAKAYHVDLDKGDGRKELPPQQTCRYINTNTKFNKYKRWGILSNGYKWRLYSDFGINHYIEFDIDHAMENIEELELFCLIFSPDSFIITRDKTDKLTDMHSESLSSWALITDEIEKKGTDIILELMNGFYREDISIDKAKEYSFSVLFKLLYILYIESKGLIRKADAGYTPLSLKALLTEMYQITFEEYGISKRISMLFETYKKGYKVLPINFGGEHFEHLNRIKIKNIFIKNALEKLTVFSAEAAEHKFLDYSSLNVELIGNIYEGTLSLIFEEKDNKIQIKKIEKKTGTKVHSTGTTYTPPNVVKYLIESIYPKELNLIPKTCDPACGSGHFLVQALRYLSAAIPFEITKAQTMQEHKRTIAQKGLFGTDTNDLAASLARLMLTIETADKDKSALDFTKNIKHFDALLTRWKKSNDWIWNFQYLEKQKAKGFDYVIGNPPYVRADEEDAYENRKPIKDSGQYEWLIKKWDLFIPFIELAVGLTKTVNGAVALVVSDGITYAPYADKCTEELSKSKHIKFVSHFSEAFPKWAFPATCFSYDWKFTSTKKTPSEKRIHESNDPCKILKTINKCKNPFLSEDKKAAVDILNSWDGLKFGDVAYISKGMVLHCHEKFQLMEPPPVKDFKKEDLIIYSKKGKKDHPFRYVESEDILFASLEESNKKYIEYGEDLRAPKYVSRATYPELHSGKRIILGRSKKGGAATIVDEDIIVSDNTIIVKLWHSIQNIDNKSIKKKVAGTKNRFMIDKKDYDYLKTRELLNHSSNSVSYELLLGILLSDYFINWMKMDKRHKHVLVPDVLSEMPLPIRPRHNRIKLVKVPNFGICFQKEIQRLKTAPFDYHDEVISFIENLVLLIIKNNQSDKISIYKGYLNNLVEILYSPIKDNTFLKEYSISFNEATRHIEDQKRVLQKAKDGKEAITKVRKKKSRL